MNLKLPEQRTIQTACDRCAQGVMDDDNDHLWGRCTCACHRQANRRAN